MIFWKVKNRLILKVVPEGWAVTITITAQPSGTTLLILVFWYQIYQNETKAFFYQLIVYHDIVPLLYRVLTVEYQYFSI